MNTKSMSKRQLRQTIRFYNNILNQSENVSWGRHLGSVLKYPVGVKTSVDRWSLQQKKIHMWVSAPFLAPTCALSLRILDIRDLTRSTSAFRTFLRRYTKPNVLRRPLSCTYWRRPGPSRRSASWTFYWDIGALLSRRSPVRHVCLIRQEAKIRNALTISPSIYRAPASQRILPFPPLLQWDHRLVSVVLNLRLIHLTSRIAKPRGSSCTVGWCTTCGNKFSRLHELWGHVRSSIPKFATSMCGAAPVSLCGVRKAPICLSQETLCGREHISDGVRRLHFQFCFRLSTARKKDPRKELSCTRVRYSKQYRQISHSILTLLTINLRVK